MKNTIKEYLDVDGKSPFSKWFDQLDHLAAIKVSTALYRLENGNFSNVKGVGAGVFEHKLDYGPGYRVYFAKVDHQILLLLAGGTKKRQNNDIELAKKNWNDYKKRRK